MSIFNRNRGKPVTSIREGLTNSFKVLSRLLESEEQIRNCAVMGRSVRMRTVKSAVASCLPSLRISFGFRYADTLAEES